MMNDKNNSKIDRNSSELGTSKNPTPKFILDSEENSLASKSYNNMGAGGDKEKERDRVVGNFDTLHNRNNFILGDVMEN